MHRRSNLEVIESYNATCSTYDEVLHHAGYCDHQQGVSALVRYVSTDALILDAAAGTGLTGLALHQFGFANIEGVDLSPGMIGVAMSRGIYCQIHQADLNRSLPLTTNSFDAVISTGTFFPDHVGDLALSELVRVCQPGGHVVATIEENLWIGSFSFRARQLEMLGAARLIELSEPYQSMPRENPNLLARVVVLAVTR